MMTDYNEIDRYIIQEIRNSASDLILYVKSVNESSGLQAIDRVYEHAICDCINRIGDGVKRLKFLSYDKDTEKKWTSLRVITAHKYEKLDLSKVWDTLVSESQNIIEESDIVLNRI